MEEAIGIRDHMNVFNNLITQLSIMETKIKKEDHSFLFITLFWLHC